MGRCTNCSELELCHLWLDPIIHHEPNEPSASKDDHELGQVSKEGGDDSSKQKTTTTKLLTKKKVKRYLHRIVQIVVLVASAAVIITNWIAYSSYATIGVTPLKDHDETIQTLWLVQAICATIVTPIAVFVKVVAPLRKWEIPKSISGYIVLFDLIVNSGGSLLISYNVFQSSGCWLDLNGSLPARQLYWEEMIKVGFKMLLLLVQIIYGLSQGYIICCVQPCAPTRQKRSEIALKSAHVILLCGLLAFAGVVMSTIVDNRNSASPVLILVYHNTTYGSASVLTRFHEVDETFPKLITATYRNPFTGDCFVYWLTFDEEKNTIIYEYQHNYINSSGDLNCDIRNITDLLKKPGFLFLKKEKVKNQLGKWPNSGDVINYDETPHRKPCHFRKGQFEYGIAGPCTFDTTCKDLKELARRNTS